MPDDLKTKLSIDDDLVSSPKEAFSRASADRVAMRNKHLKRWDISSHLSCTYSQLLIYVCGLCPKETWRRYCKAKCFEIKHFENLMYMYMYIISINLALIVWVAISIFIAFFLFSHAKFLCCKSVHMQLSLHQLIL